MSSFFLPLTCSADLLLKRVDVKKPAIVYFTAILDFKLEWTVRGGGKRRQKDIKYSLLYCLPSLSFWPSPTPLVQNSSPPQPSADEKVKEGSYIFTKSVLSTCPSKLRLLCKLFRHQIRLRKIFHFRKRTFSRLGSFAHKFFPEKNFVSLLNR